MANNDYISNIFADDTLVGGDIRQTLQYNLVKAYPSVNSTNGGQIHSEENVRWLTRQFTKKPFIIPYSNNEDFDEFWYEGASLNVGRSNGGMVNIDGYIINTVDNIEKTSFDNTQNTALATGDGNGYIAHQRLQRAIGEILTEFNSEIQDYISTFIMLWAQSGLLSDNITKLMQTLSYNYKKLIGEDVSDIDPTTIFNKLSEQYSEWADDAIAVKCGTYEITYSGTLAKYIHNNFDITELINTYDFIEQVTDESVDDNYVYKITYKVFYGIIQDRFEPIKSGNNYISSLYIKDILGMYYIWQTKNTTVTTHPYPATGDYNINFLNDTITPRDTSGHVEEGLTLSQTNLYSFTENNYQKFNKDDPNYAEFRYMVSGLSNTTLYSNISEENLFVRTDFISNAANPPTQKTLSNYFNSDRFDIVTASTIIGMYETYKSSEVVTSDFTAGPLSNLCDSYYCLPLDELDSNCKQLLCLDNNGTPIEVGFLTGSGILMVRNYEYTTRSGDTDIKHIFIEGYVSFFRRLVAKVCNIDLTTLPNPNTYNSSEWDQVLKRFQLGEISANVSALPILEQTLFTNIFNTTNITFEMLYNTFLAPYINFHIQLAWSSLYDFNVLPNNVTNSKYKTHWGYNVIKDNISSDIPQVDDRTAGVGDHLRQYPHINLQLSHIYSHNGTTYEIPKYLTYFYNQYTDNNRLNTFINHNTYTEWAPEFGYWNNFTNFETYENKYQLCEDYITYLKNCSCRGYDDTYNENYYSNNAKIGLLNIKYSVTTTNFTNGVYGFSIYDKIVDRVAKFVNFDTHTSEGYTKYSNITDTNISADEKLFSIEPGYINNVAIRLDTLYPERRSYNENQFFYPNTSQPYPTANNQSSPMSPSTYDLWLTKFITVEYDGAYIPGTTGWCFTARSQSMTTYIPTLFRLYKDSQNYLNGIKNDGSSIHAGIYIDYKFPKDINTTDFWFSNTWLSNISFINIYEIESHNSSYPSSTDGLVKYLSVRNKTILSIDQIYDINEEKDFTPLKTVINNYISSNNKLLQEDINYLKGEIVSTEFTFNEAVSVPRNDLINTTDLIYKNITITGLENAINEVSNQIEYNTNAYECSQPHIQENIPIITLKNNKFFDIKGISYPEIRITFEHDFSNSTENYFNFGIDTQKQKVFRSTIRLTISNTCKIYLSNSPYKIATNMNTINNMLTVTWSSNYPIVKCGYRTTPTQSIDNIPYGTTDDYILINNTSDNNEHDILIDVVITYNDNPLITDPYCEAHCNISIVNDSNQLTIDDVNYLVKANYSLDILTWGQVSTLTKKGLARKLWNVGDIKTFRLNYTDPVSSTTSHVDVPAMIIGFDQDGPNTITWMTQQGSPNTDSSDIGFGPVLNQKFMSELGVSANDGYNPNTDNTYEGTTLWHWLNDLGENKISIASCIDTGMRSIILPARKISRMLYLVNKDGIYHKYGYDENSHGSCGYYKYHDIKWASDNTSVYNVPADQFDNYGLYSSMGGDMFWLPSMMELGINTIGESIDNAEHSAYETAVDTSGEYYEPEVYKFNSLRINPFGQRTDCDRYSIYEFAYDYFKQPKLLQNTNCDYIFCRDYYAIRSDNITDTSITFDSELPTDLYNKFNTVNRAYHVVSQSVNPYASDKHHLTHIDRNTINTIAVQNEGIITGFCFVTH